jgi:SRSO17 transposase
VVSVTSLWADAQVYYPLLVEPYTPQSYFARGRNDPAFRTKLKIALQLVEQAVEEGWPFRAVVADNFYGEDRGLKRGLRMWVEQSYKQIKHALGWSQYQVRSDQALRRHWQLVCCAFSFCWYHASHSSANKAETAKEPSEPPVGSPANVASDEVATGKKNQHGKRGSSTGVLAGGIASGTRMAGTLHYAQTLLERLVATAPTS